MAEWGPMFGKTLELLAGGIQKNVKTLGELRIPDQAEDFLKLVMRIHDDASHMVHCIEDVIGSVPASGESEG